MNSSIYSQHTATGISVTFARLHLECMPTLHPSHASLSFFAGHYLEHAPVGLIHSILANAREIMNRAVNIVIYDALDRSDTFLLHGKHCRQHSSADARCQFEST